jgi:hypothetical protein
LIFDATHSFFFSERRCLIIKKKDTFVQTPIKRGKISEGRCKSPLGRKQVTRAK